MARMPRQNLVMQSILAEFSKHKKFEGVSMRLNNLPVAYKLWGVVLGAMAAMLALSVALTMLAERRAIALNLKTQQADQRITTTMRWMALTELTV